MFTISIKIGFKPKEREVNQITCFGCARKFAIHRDNLRATNYCSSCK